MIQKRRANSQRELPRKECLEIVNQEQDLEGEEGAKGYKIEYENQEKVDNGENASR